MTSLKSHRQSKTLWAIVLMGAFIFYLSSVSGWSNNSFNNSLTTESLIFIGGFEGISICYQESANVSTSCGGLNTGSYFFSDTSSGNEYLYIDGDWDTSYDIYPNSYIDINYSKPIGSQSAKWQIKGNNLFQNITIPNICFNQNKLILRVQEGSVVDYKCYNGTDYQIILSSPNDLYGNYEEAIIWDYGIRRYLSVPQNTILTRGFLNLSGVNTDYFSYNNTESLIGSSPSATGIPANYDLTNTYDNNWDTFGTVNRGGGNNDCEIAFCQLNLTKTFTISNTSSIQNFTVYWKIDGVGYCSSPTPPTVRVQAYNYTSASWVNVVSETATVTYQSSPCQWNYDTFFSSTFSNKNDYWSVSNVQIRTIIEGQGRIYNLSLNEMNLTYSQLIDNSTTNITLRINNINIFNYTNKFIQTNNRTNNLASFINQYLNATYLVGTNYIIPFIFHSDTAGILQYLDLLFSNEGFLENNQTYQTPIYDTEMDSISINITYDPNEYSSVSGTLTYNSSSYLGSASGSGGNRRFTRSMEIPIVSTQTNKSFYWTFSMTNSSGTTRYNSTINNQTINPSNLSYCTSGQRAVNYSIRDEDTNNLITSDFEATLLWKLNQSSTLRKSSSSDLSGANSYTFCVNANKTFFTESKIKIFADGYDTRTLDLAFEEYNNVTTTNKILYLLNDSAARTVIIEAKDAGLASLRGYTIRIYRYQMSTNEQILVEEDVTDIFGQIVASLVENDVKYQFKFYNSLGTLLKETGDMVISCRASVCIQPFVIKEADTTFDRFENITSYEYFLSFSNVTNSFTFTWADNTGGSPTHRLLVTRFLMNGTQEICNDQSVALSGSLICPVGNSSSSYTAQAFRTINGKETRIALLEYKVNPPSDTFGLEGFFWSFILLFTVIIIGIFSPILGIILYLIGLIALGLIGVVYIDPVLIIAQIVMGGMFIWAFRG